MIWFFGDSYSVPLTYPGIKEKCWNYESVWSETLAEKLDMPRSYRAMYGVANEWIFAQVMEEVPSFESGDVVIIQTTSSSRRWFFKDRPDLGNFINTITNGLSKEEEKALEMYTSYLYHEEQNDMFYSAFLYSFAHMAYVYKKDNVKIVILPGFHGCPGVLGDLTSSVCDKEFKDIGVRNNFYKKHKWDPRINHMSQENHYILAEKLYNNIAKNEQLNLTNGFITNIYN